MKKLALTFALAMILSAMPLMAQTNTTPTTPPNPPPASNGASDTHTGELSSIPMPPVDGDEDEESAPSAEEAK